MSIGGLKGGSTHDPDGDKILFDTLKQNLNPEIPLIEMDRHVNEEEFAERVFQEFMRCILIH